MRRVSSLACTLAIVGLIAPGCGSGSTTPSADATKPVVAPNLPSKPPIPGKKAANRPKF